MRRLKAGDLLQWQVQTLALFYQVKVRQALGADKADGDTAFAGAPGSTDAVRVIERGARQVVIHHHRQQRNIQATRRHVGGNHDLDACGLEIRQHLAALALAQLAMKGLGIDARLAQLVGNHLRAVAACHKNQYLSPVVLLDQMAQELRPVRRVDSNGTLRNIGLGQWFGAQHDAMRVAQQRLRQCLQRWREGG